MSDGPPTTSAGSDASPRPGGTEEPRPGRSFSAALLLTVLNTALPGTAFLAAGRRRLGALVLAVFLLLIAGAAYLATAGRRSAVRLAVDPHWLLGIIGLIAVVALAWIVVVVAGYRLLLPRRASGPQRLVGALVVLALAALVAGPAVQIGRVAQAQRELVTGLFGPHQSATASSGGSFAGKDRVNVLLLGGDSGPGREGLRTDTVIVASVDTHTGAAVLFSLPRNLENLPFPPDSPLAQLYPQGFQAGVEGESLLNAVYDNGPAAHPGVLGPSDNPGADWLKLGVGQALGLSIDYFVLVNLEGFSRLVDALGGITVNVNYWVPVNGIPNSPVLPDDYIAPGPNQHLDGYLALQFARGRYGLTDYDRMARQRCTLDAIRRAADPATVVRSYQELARTTRDIVSTDIPQTALGDFVDLAFEAKKAPVRSVVFDEQVINPAYPDYDEIRAIVRTALTAAPAATTAPPSTTAPPPAPSPAPSPTLRGAGPTSSGVPPSPAASPVTDLTGACAYDPARAAAALAAGKPPTRHG